MTEVEKQPRADVIPDCSTSVFWAELSQWKTVARAPLDRQWCCVGLDAGAPGASWGAGKPGAKVERSDSLSQITTPALCDK